MGSLSLSDNGGETEESCNKRGCAGVPSVPIWI